jgi:hypothetical protein
MVEVPGMQRQLTCEETSVAAASEQSTRPAVELDSMRLAVLTLSPKRLAGEKKLYSLVQFLHIVYRGTLERKNVTWILLHLQLARGLLLTATDFKHAQQ